MKLNVFKNMFVQVKKYILFFYFFSV